MIGLYIGIILLLILDQCVKYWIVANLALNTGKPLIDGLVSLFYLRNDGAAWGILSGNMLFFFIITLAVLGGLAYWMHHQKHGLLDRCAYVLIVSGALGNFIDRIRLGYVIDMFKFDFVDFPIFNVADVCLTLGVGLLILEALLPEKWQKGPVKNARY